jgi:hypothetical protein
MLLLLPPPAAAAAVVRHLLYDKELLEYRHWLEGVQGFVGGK